MSTPRLGRPPSVTVEQVVAAGVDVGLADLTLSAVAGSLGLSVPALYRYVHDREDLARRVGQQLLSTCLVPDDPALTTAEFLVEASVQLRAVLARHRGLAMLHLRVWDLPAIARRAAAVEGRLMRAGLDADTAELLHYDLTCFTLAFVATEGPEVHEPDVDEGQEVSPERMFRWTVGVHARGLLDAVAHGDLPWT